MASRLHYRSIRSKFSLIIISACFAVLLLVSLLFAGIEYTSFRQKTAEDLETLAAILGKNLTEPLLNNQKKLYKAEAHEILASLNKNPTLHAAYLFNRKNEPIAYYLDSEFIPFVQNSIEQDFSGNFPDEWKQSEAPRVHFGLKHLSLYSPIYYLDTKIGGLYLLSALSEIEQRLVGLLMVVLLAGGIAVGFAWLLAGWMQRPISMPILHLAETMHKVSTENIYHLRAQKQSDDEVGQLVDGFNDMLSQIEIRDLEIETHQKYLEQTVRERTAELTRTVIDLDRSREQAESASQAKSIFLANMTHELRTPLVGVLGMNELLIETSLGSQQRALAESVQRSGRELLELINDILDFSKIEGGHLKLDLTKVDLLKLIEETVKLLAVKAYDKGIEFLCNVDPNAAWEVEADAQRLKQIIINLLSNAIKFTQSGHVGLKLTRSTNNHFLFEVCDTGIGIDKENQTSIFEVFSQVDESTSRFFGGTGLGLSIVRDLTKMMQGTVRLESEPGLGSTFQVELPLKQEKPVFAELSDSSRARSVILFEPYPPARDSLLQRLNDLDFYAEAVSTHDEFLQRLRNVERDGECFDIVILPGCGWEGSQELISQAKKCCSIVICQQRNSAESAHSPSVIEIPKPLLWSSLLKADLDQQNEQKSLPAPAIKLENSPLLQADNPAVKGKILIVDDNTSTRELIGFSLVGSGWQCDEACNAEEALVAVGNELYLLILMDINMPSTDGLEVTRMMRKQGVKTPIYALTAHGDAKVFELCHQAGMQGSLRKPFRQKELFALLDENSTLNSKKQGTSYGEGEPLA